ncbi:unnamed protein product [Schistocephalus solidus]|uniref:Cadherin domain protein n=1 Tax=Schistocephalus solidus TaxID=70667 RepID=A0A183SDR5_SCHSO|nr:unnamed protein product [Schistocephalus solidus]
MAVFWSEYKSRDKPLLKPLFTVFLITLSAASSALSDTTVSSFANNCSIIIQENLPRGFLLPLPVALTGDFKLQVAEASAYFTVVREEASSQRLQQWREKVWIPPSNPFSSRNIDSLTFPPSSTTGGQWFLTLLQRIDREQLCQTEPACDCHRGNSHPLRQTSTTPDDVSQRCVVPLHLVAIPEVSSVSSSPQLTAPRLPTVLDLEVCIADENDNAPVFQVGSRMETSAASGAAAAGVKAAEFFQQNTWLPTTKLQAPVYVVHLNENTEVSTLIPLPNALDADAFPEHTVQSYALHCPSNQRTSSGDEDLGLHFAADSPFSLSYDVNRGEDHSLALRVEKLLSLSSNAVKKWPLYCSVSAYDGQHTGSLHLQIALDDVNDHAPQWQAPTLLNSAVSIVTENATLGLWSVSLPESVPPFTVLLRLRAVDEDPVFGKVKFAVEHSQHKSALLRQPFDVDSRTGEVRLLNKLDYENPLIRHQDLVIGVVAKDNGGLSTTGKITFKILDVNDNRPVIRFASLATTQSLRAESSEYPTRRTGLELVENSAETKYLDYVTVKDEDSGSNGQVSCSLRPSQIADHFNLTRIGDHMWALLAVKPIDRESLPRDNFASSMAQQQASNHYFSGSGYKRPFGSRIGLTVVCNDNPGAYQTYQLTSETTVQISIRDENDNAPHFTSVKSSEDGELVLEAAVLEGLPPGSQVMRVLAEDPDLGDSLRFSLIHLPAIQPNAVDVWPSSSSAVADRLAIDPITGVITTQCVFDREREDFINDVGVVVFDGGWTQRPNDKSADAVSAAAANHTIVARLELHILDVNDNAPTFHGNTVLSIPEDTPLESLIIQINITDPDLGENGTATVYFSPHQVSTLSTANPFSLYPDGRLVLSRRLDRERVDHYELIILASDKGRPAALTSTTTLVIQVEDVNDSPPRFELSTGSLLRSVSCTQAYIALDLVASDADSLPENSVIKYRIVSVTGPFGDSKRGGGSAELALKAAASETETPDVTHLFFIQPDTGALFLNSPGGLNPNPQAQSEGLDPCDHLGVYRLVLMAFDPKRPEMSSNVSLTVHIVHEEHVMAKVLTKLPEHSGEAARNGSASVSASAPSSASILQPQEGTEIKRQERRYPTPPLAPSGLVVAVGPSDSQQDQQHHQQQQLDYRTGPPRNSRMAFLVILLLIAVFIGLTLLLIVLVYFFKRRNILTRSRSGDLTEVSQHCLTGLTIGQMEKEAAALGTVTYGATSLLPKTEDFSGNVIVLADPIYGTTRPRTEKPVDGETTNVICRIQCDSCEVNFVGEKGKWLQIRVTKHVRAVRRRDPLFLVAEYCANSRPTFVCQNSGILGRGNDRVSWETIEAWHMEPTSIQHSVALQAAYCALLAQLIECKSKHEIRPNVNSTAGEPTTDRHITTPNSRADEVAIINATASITTPNRGGDMQSEGHKQK